MIFNSLTYLLLLIVVVPLYWVLPYRARLLLIFFASIDAAPGIGDKTPTPIAVEFLSILQISEINISTLFVFIIFREKVSK